MIRLFELVLSESLLGVEVGFAGAVLVDGTLREVVGTATCDNQGAPAIAVRLLVCVRAIRVQSARFRWRL